MSPVAAAGRLHIWQNGMLWVGAVGGPTDVHAHRAIQVALALEGTLRFSAAGAGDWLDCGGAVLTADCEHAVDGRQAPRIAVLFLEPESKVGRAVTRRYAGPNGIGVIPETLHRVAVGLIAPHARRGAEQAPLVAAAQEVLASLAGAAVAPSPTDPRVLRATALLRGNLDAPVSLERVAAAVHLSPDRLRHLFADQLGVGFRPYVLWLRLNRALEMYAAGESLTTAAHAAGFADSAHLSRTFRRMFGLPPGMVRLE